MAARASLSPTNDPRPSISNLRSTLPQPAAHRGSRPSPRRPVIYRRGRAKPVRRRGRGECRSEGFSEGFYWRRTGGHFDAVLETLQYIRRESDVWLEITTMLIAGENDSEREIDALTGWIVEELGDETPLHFTALWP